MTNPLSATRELLQLCLEKIEAYHKHQGGEYVGGMPNQVLLPRLREAIKSESSAVASTGWRLVPEEATAEMVQAAEDRHVEGANYIAESSIQFALWREVWRAMLRAAPKAPRSSTTSSADLIYRLHNWCNTGPWKDVVEDAQELMSEAAEALSKRSANKCAVPPSEDPPSLR